MRKQNRQKSEKRRRLRYKENEEAIKQKILQIQGDTELTLDEDFVIDYDILIPDAIATLKVHEMCYLSSILNNTPATTQVVQSLNSPFFPSPIGAEPGRAKGESRITCMRMLRTNQSKITRVHTTLLASMCCAMPFSARALKKKSTFSLTLILW